ncbi:hypothetical protein MKX03_018144 [Papaver bracteatum]|nr:hypothetical protein MKX03_018144 [Papaver bracteatum]
MDTPFLFCVENSGGGGSGIAISEVGWYVLGENQEHVGPYAFSKLQAATSNNDDEFAKWQTWRVDVERPSTPPDGEEEFTDDDGTPYKWDRGLRAWVPQMTYPQEEELFPSVLGTDISSKGKVDDTTKTEEAKPDTKRKAPEKEEKKEANKPPDSWFDLKVNTHVYITGLLYDVTAEVVEVFSRCGVIKEEPSFELAIKILDRAPFRPGGTPLVTVSPAKFEPKGDKFITKQVDKKKN